MNPWTFAACLLAFLALGIAISPRECPSFVGAEASVRKPGDPPVKQTAAQETQNHKDGANNPPQKLNSFLDAGIDKTFCFFGWLKSYEAVVNVFLTLAIAWFTWLLAQSTRELWTATRNVAIAAERSSVIAQRGMDPWLLPVVVAYGFHVEGRRGAVADLPALSFKLRNYGGSPAIINLIRYELIPAPNPPTEEIGDRIPLPKGRVIRDDKASIPFVVKPRPKSRLSEEERAKLENQDAFLWFHGVVEYDDIFGGGFVTTFCWRYDAKAELFEPYDKDYKRNKCVRKVSPPPETTT